MAPEQADGRVDVIDARTDIYALGVILLQLLTGALPFQGKSTTEILDQLTISIAAPPPREASIGAFGVHWKRSGLKAMHADRESRYGSSRKLANDVERYLADEPVSAYRNLSRRARARVARRHRTAAATISLAVLFAAIALTAGMWIRRVRASN